MDFTNLVEIAFTWLSNIFLISLTMCSLYLFFKTKEIYNLTENVKLKYFRNILLFFSINYILSFISDFLLYLIFEIIPEYIETILLGVNIFIQTILIFNLVLLFFHKRLKKYLISKNYLICLIAFVMSALAIRFVIAGIALYILMVIIVLAFIIALISIQKNKFYMKGQKKSMYIIYLIIFGHGVISSIFNFFSWIFPIVGFVGYAITYSLFIFLVIKFVNATYQRKFEDEKKK